MRTHNASRAATLEDAETGNGVRMSRSKDDVGSLALLAMALACWIAAIAHIGESHAGFLAGLATALTLAGLALMRPWIHHR
jgi:hypothetical protein